MNDPDYHTLKITLTAPSLSQPFTGTYEAGEKIIIDINKPGDFPPGPVDLSKISNIIVGGNITLDKAFPPNSQFTSISYSGNSLLLYDANGNDISRNTNYSLVKRIVASPTSSSNSNMLFSILFSCCCILIIGISVGIYFYLKPKTPEPSKKGGFFKLGE